MKNDTREELKNLLVVFAELNVAIGNFLNSGGNMSKEKTTVEETVTAEASVEQVEAQVAEGAVAEAEKTAEVVETVASTETDKEVKEETVVAEAVASTEVVAEPAPAAEVVTETAEAAMVTQETVVSERVSVSDGKAGVYATQETVTRTVVDQYVDTEKKEEEAEGSAPVAAVASDPLAEKITAEGATKLGLSETEASLVVGMSFIDLVKVVASLTQEVVQYRDKAKAAELEKATEARIDELKQLEVSLDLSVGSADYSRIAGMDDATFAAYRDGIRDVRKTTASAPVVVEQTLEKAKASLAGLAVPVSLTKENRRSLFQKLN